MIYSAVLILHITAACTTGLLGAYALYIVGRKRDASYRPVALALGFVAGFEVASGTLLAVLSPELTAAYLTSHIALYIGACMAVEALLFVRMQKISLAFPTTLAASPVLASLAFFVVALTYGF